jgi:Purple acid Phosphatase, N-terminal domain/Calcineurin-like phosphoesterase
MSDQRLSAVGDGAGLSRRAFLKGAVGFGLAVGIAGLTDGAFFYEDAFAAADPGNTTVPLPTTTAPEQLHLQWGADPTRSVTVSWVAPGTTAQPAPRLAYSTSPITATNPGKVIELPPPAPLDMTRPRPLAATTSFADGLSGFTTFHYHVQLNDLAPNTTYYYQACDGAAIPSVVGSSFKTAPVGRMPFRFSSFGDMGAPTSASPVNVSGYTWTEANDRCVATVAAIEDPGDGLGAPLFHLLNGDLCYANLDPANTANVWRDFGVNLARSAANRPWMPTIGNHENEFGVTDHSGHPHPGPVSQAGASGSFYNGPYGNGHYHSRFLLPDNGVVNYDGNRLQGAFYKFQVGTVLFVAVDADDVIYQQNNNSRVGAGTTFQSGAAIPAGTLGDNREYTGTLALEASNNSLVPAAPTPNVQALWLEETLAEGRRDPSVDMIVVFMHQVALSTALNGNGSDLGIRQAWGPLFDRYQVDLVLAGHEHNYERSYPVRGYDPPAGTVTTAFDSYAVGDTIDTRRPTVVITRPAMLAGVSAWNTAAGTVYLVLGGGGASSTLPYGQDPKNGLPQATVWVTHNGRDAVEDAPWSAARDAGDAYGYAIFDVDPGHVPGQTTITMKYFQVPVTTTGEPASPDTTPFETHIFGRRVPVVAGQAPRGPFPGQSVPGWPRLRGGAPRP